MIELVQGRPVFATDDAARRAVAEANLPTPRKLGLELGAWNAVLERALALRAPERYPDANAFLKALDASLDGATRDPVALVLRRSTPPILAATTQRPAPARSSTPSMTVGTGVRNMAYRLEEIGGRQIFIALHTARPPSGDEWRGWTELIEANCITNDWDIEKTANFVVTDGGAPNTAQRTVVNTLIAQAKTLPAVAVVTSSMIVRTMLRGFSIFNPNIAVFAPHDVAKAAEYVGVARADLAVLIAACSKLEHDVLHTGAVETLGVLARMRI